MIRITLGQRLRAILFPSWEKSPQIQGLWSTHTKNLHKTTSASPLLSNKGDVELVSLKFFPGIGHHLIEGSLQQVVPTNDEPGKEKKPCGQ